MSDSEDVPSVSPADLQTRIDRGEPVRVLDLRNRDEVERWAIAGPSVTLTQRPHNRFVQARVTDAVEGFVADVDGEGPITVVCARGEASAAVAGHLHERGYDAHNLAGGMEAWARLALTSDLAWPGDDPPATVVQVRRPASGCLGYVVVSGDEAAVVDPLRAFADEYVAAARERGATLAYAVDTHLHADHVSGLRAVAAATDATPVMPAATTERGVSFDVETVADGDALRVGDAVLGAVHAPGHTTGMTAVAVRDGSAAAADDAVPPVLLTGDSLFLDGVARPDLERGEAARELARELHRTLTERFARFPGETAVAPGHHGPAPRLDDAGRHTAPLGELRELPAFATSVDAFVADVTDDLPHRPANAERVVDINCGRESVDAETAFELELGPNNCAAVTATE